MNFQTSISFYGDDFYILYSWSNLLSKLLSQIQKFITNRSIILRNLNFYASWI